MATSHYLTSVRHTREPCARRFGWRGTSVGLAAANECGATGASVRGAPEADELLGVLARAAFQALRRAPTRSLSHSPRCDTTVLDLPPIGSSHAPTSCLCTGTQRVRPTGASVGRPSQERRHRRRGGQPGSAVRSEDGPTTTLSVPDAAGRRPSSATLTGTTPTVRRATGASATRPTHGGRDHRRDASRPAEPSRRSATGSGLSACVAQVCVSRRHSRH